MNDTETEYSPCTLSKQELTMNLQGFLTENEYIKDWEMSSDGKGLTIWIYKEDTK